MAATMTATLAKWGNSQGIRFPKDVCERLGLHIGSTVDMRIDEAKSEIILSFPEDNRKYSRNRKVTLEELCSGWTGGKVGEESIVCDVEAEVVR